MTKMSAVRSFCQINGIMGTTSVMRGTNMSKYYAIHNMFVFFLSSFVVFEECMRINTLTNRLGIFLTKKGLTCYGAATSD